MTCPYDRLHILFAQGRWTLAEQEVRKSLLSDPDDTTTRAYLALCLAKQQRLNEAESEARRAVELDPDDAFVFYTLAYVLDEGERIREALPLIDRAIDLDPTDADYHELRGWLLSKRGEWQTALEAAEQGLSLEPEHEGCGNLRATMLTKLGRGGEAGQAVRELLRQSPENSESHANMGWTLLETRQYPRAMEHFREALRIDPENHWVREGIVEAMKARNRLYRPLLRYLLWSRRTSLGTQLAVVAGIVIVSRLLRPSNHPEWGHLLMSLNGLLLFAFILMIIGESVFNLLLRSDPLGRQALTEDQTAEANWTLAILLVGAAAVMMGPIIGFSMTLFGLLCFFLMAGIQSTYLQKAGRRRRRMAVFTAVLFALLFLRTGLALAGFREAQMLDLVLVAGVLVIICAPQMITR